MPLVSVANLRESRRHRDKREICGIASVELLPVYGADTRASAVGRTEYADATVRSFAFWL